MIADTFTIIRNAIKIHSEEAVVPYSNVVLKICQILKDHSYIANFKKIKSESFDQIKVYLKYDGKKSAINQIKRVSRPSRRVYKKRDQIPSVLRGLGIAIISTSEGIFTDSQAREQGLGGEVVGMVW